MKLGWGLRMASKTSTSLALLRDAKRALEEGLISQADFDAAKASYVATNERELALQLRQVEVPFIIILFR